MLFNNWIFKCFLLLSPHLTLFFSVKLYSHIIGNMKNSTFFKNVILPKLCYLYRIFFNYYVYSFSFYECILSTCNYTKNIVLIKSKHIK